MKLKHNPLNNKYQFGLLLIVATIAIVFFAFSHIVDDDTVGPFTSIYTIISGLSVIYLISRLVRKYKRTQSLRKAYVALLIAFSGYVGAEVIWYGLDELGYDTYPSIADFSYLIYYIFALLHIIITIDYFFKRNWSDFIYISGIIFMVMITYSFSVGYLFEESPQVFIYSGAFIFLNAGLLAVSGFTLWKIRNTKMLFPWIFITASIFLSAIVDTYYYHLEVIGEYSYRGFENTLWIISDMIMVYALAIHKRRI
jgi:hypothetical protein